MSLIKYPTADTLDVFNKAVLVRVDFNIAATSDGGLSDDYRLQAHVPGIKELLARGARVILLTHRGRPQGEVVPELSTLPLVAPLSALLGQPVGHVPDCVGRVAEYAVNQLQGGQALLLENTRFHLGEELNQRPFVQELAKLGNIFVNDAFASAHRAHASTSGLAAAVPQSVLGPLMIEEIMRARALMQEPPRPLLAMIGGAYAPDKIDLIESLVTKVDMLAVGGVLAGLFLAGREAGLGVGWSLPDPLLRRRIREIFTTAGVVGCRLLLPTDMWVRHRGNGTVVCASTDAVFPDGAELMDIGPETTESWARFIGEAQSVLWLGCLGVCEQAPFDMGTLAVAAALDNSSAQHTIAGDVLVGTLRHAARGRNLGGLCSGSAALRTLLRGQPLPALQVLKLTA